MKKKLWLTASSLLLLVLLGACTNNTEPKIEGEKISIMTSFYPMYDFTKHIVGDLGEVEMLIPSGTEAHDYEPSAKDLKKIQDSDVFVYNNENMETWVPAIDSTLKEGNVSVIKATENLVLLPGADDGHDHHHHDDEEEHG
ncbi:zinc ABC transporter substrate-binding protein, partial [Acinetobacter baumannii]|nr:zinc ABC transporter substrate-binding protein [Acinetobacter baumannii]